MSGDDAVGRTDYYHSREFVDRRNLQDDLRRQSFREGQYIDEFTTVVEDIPLITAPDGQVCFDTKKYLADSGKSIVAIAKETLSQLPKCLRQKEIDGGLDQNDNNQW